MNLPAEEIQPVRTHSDTYSHSRSPKSGSLTGIIKLSQRGIRRFFRIVLYRPYPYKVPALSREKLCPVAYEIRVLRPPSVVYLLRAVVPSTPTGARYCKYRLRRDLGAQKAPRMCRSDASQADDAHAVEFHLRWDK